MIELMTAEEERKFKNDIRRVWEEVSLEKLESALRFEQRAKQRADFRVAVLTDLINKIKGTNIYEIRKPDNKSKQFND